MDCSKVTQYPTDTVILNQGTVSHEIYKILSGNVALYINYGQPDEYLIGLLSKGRCFGEMSVLCGRPNMHTVVTCNDTVLMSVHEDMLHDFIRNNPQNAIDIMKNLAQCLAALNLNLNMLIEENSRQKDSDTIDISRISGLLKCYTDYTPEGEEIFSMKV